MNVLAWPAFDNKTGNPYTRLLYEAVEAEGDVSVREFTPRAAMRGDHDVWHVHWPDDFLSYASPLTATAYVAAELALMALARQRGTRLVWTIHDLGPHESPHPWLERLFWPLFLPMVDGYITLSEHAREAALRRFPRLSMVPGAVVPHGHYRPAYPDPVPAETARRRLGLSADAPVIAYVGRIRPYKNVDRLIEAFGALDRPDARLLVTGNPANRAVEDTVRRAARSDDRVRLDLRFVPTDEMPDVLGAADLVALPYEDIMHSGSALLALSFDRPVLVPAAGAMHELQDDVGADWVQTYEGALTATVLDAALTAAREADRAARAPLDHRAWGALARQTAALYERVLAS
jgi:glycosyltransferase involved in cell wall biosynthesis